MDKNPGYIPRFLTGYSGPGSGASRAFQILVRGIGEAKSKYEEDKIIREEFAILKEKLSQPSSSKQMREYLIRLIYCEMLGVDASSFHIHAINFAQQRNLHDKKMGYLALSVFLHENHSLILLLINTLQRDLTSTNVLEVCYALTAVNKLINAEMIPTVLQQVLALLNSKRDIIRKKAVMALHTIYKKSPSLVPDVKERAIKALNDRDFSVSIAALHILYDMVVVDPSLHKDLVPALVALLTKIISGKLNLEFDFHKIPAPWAQIKILRILSLLGAYDLQASKQMYDVLQKALSSLNTSTLISFAVAYECTRTIASIYPDKKLKKLVSKCVGLFLVANSNDIKYLGINALTSLIDVDASFATDPSYQRIVINCLDDPDETLKRKTLDLLCRITNADNVESICDRLIKHLRNTIDIYFRTDLVARVTELAERYAPDNSWYILTMNEVLELGGDLVREDVAHNLMRLIAEGNEDEEAEEELRRFAVISYMDLLEKPVLPDILIQVISWVIGEYSYAASEIDQETIIEKMCTLLERNYSEPTTKRWIITAIGKIISRTNGQKIPDSVEHTLNQVSTDGDVDMRQRCHEIRILSKDLGIMRNALPEDASCEDLEVDSTLSFLDDFVTKALQNGANPYKPETERKKEQYEESRDVKPVEPTLKITPYQLPQRSRTTPTQPTQHENTHETHKEKPKTHKSSKRKVLEDPASSKPLSGIKGPWGPKGYSKGHGSPGSGSVDSSSMSGSSSKSSGSERSPVVKTNAESTPSPLVFAHEDQTKQAVVDGIFKGVGTSSSQQQKKTGIRGNPRTTRPPRSRNPYIQDFSDPGSAPTPPPRKYLEKDTQKARKEIDLLLDLEIGDNSDKPVSDEAGRNNELVTSEDHIMVFTAEHIDNTQSTSTSSIENSEVDSSSSSTLKHNENAASDLLVNQRVGDITMESDSPVHLSENSSSSNKQGLTEHLLDTDIAEIVPSLNTDESSAASLMLPESLQEYPCAPEKIELCCDANLRVVLQKVYKPDELVLVVFLTNQSQGNLPITNLVTVFEPPSNLKASFDSTNDNRFVDAELGPLSSITHCIMLNYKSPALHMTLSGKVSYKDITSTAKHLFISLTLPIRDLVRPLTIDTESFGTHWSETPFERRKTIGSKVVNAEKFVEIVEDGLGVKKVDIIGSKAIAAGTILQGPVCLLHGTVDSDGTLDIRIKTNSQLLSDAFIKQCTTIFK